MQQGHIVGVCIFLAGGFGPVVHVDVEKHRREDGSLGHSVLQASPSAGDTIRGGEDEASVGYYLHDAPFLNLSGSAVALALGLGAKRCHRQLTGQPSPRQPSFSLQKLFQCHLLAK